MRRLELELSFSELSSRRLLLWLSFVLFCPVLPKKLITFEAVSELFLWGALFSITSKLSRVRSA